MLDPDPDQKPTERQDPDPKKSFRIHNTATHCCYAVMPACSGHKQIGTGVSPESFHCQRS